ncbi:glycosyltransferase family 4 protein [Gemmatimonadota bacterium]
MSRRLKVLHVHSGNLFGGIESILVTLARCQETEIEHTFALCFEGRIANELRDTNANVLLTAPARLSRPWSVHQARALLREELTKSHFDVAICHSSWSRAIFGPVLISARQPFVIWQHSAGDRQHWLDRWSRRIPTQLTVCNSHYTAKQEARREPAVGTAVVYPPVPPPTASSRLASTRENVREELGAPTNTTVILQVGRIEPGKGHLIHLEAAATLLDQPDWIIVQVGAAQRPEEQTYQLELERSTHDLGLDGRVRFVGERTDMDRIYAAADIYCQPSTLPESFGITFVEALYAGLPVVTTEIGAAPEIVKKECGVLVPRENAAAVAAALRLLLSDKEVRVRLGRNGPARAAALCDPASTVARLHGILSEIVG